MQFNETALRKLFKDEMRKGKFIYQLVEHHFNYDCANNKFYYDHVEFAYQSWCVGRQNLILQGVGNELPFIDIKDFSVIERDNQDIPEEVKLSVGEMT